MIKTAQDIIIAPVITEKSSEQMADGKYTFKVAVDATKTDVKKACEALFDVKVTAVNIANFDGKVRRQRYQFGRTPAFKKAVVTIDTEGSDVKYLGKGGKEVKAGKKYKNSIEDFGFGV
jgi:large subunit ribosomal protein L23